MNIRRLLLFALAILGLSLGATRAASPAENRAFGAAERSFRDGMWARAEREFAEFTERFPKSERRPDAILHQAQAQLRQDNAASAIPLLATNLPAAAALTDEYQFWLGEAQFQRGEFTAAAEAYQTLLKNSATSPRRLEALLGEASAQARLGKWAQVVESLGKPDSEFARAVPTAAAQPIVVSGLLLLAEAHWEGRNFPAVLATLAPLEGRTLGGALDWRAVRLRCLAQLAEGKLPEALTTSSNLVLLAATVPENRPPAVAESVALEAEALERSGRRGEAALLWQQNLQTGLPLERQRQALLKSTELLLSEQRLTEAGSNLVRFLEQTNNPVAVTAEASLALGEIQLRQAASLLETNRLSSEGTNLVTVALERLERVLAATTNAALAGRADLGRGWCFWLRRQWNESALAFEQAATRLGDAEQMPVARFKQGDALYQLREFGRALTAYLAAAEAAPRWPQARAALGVELYSQILRSSLEVTNVAAATNAMERILAEHPRDETAQRNLLLLVQGLADNGQPQLARAEYDKFIAVAPDFRLRAELEIILGRAREREGDWAGAAAGYAQWLQRFPTNALRPQVEFQLALANFRAGNDTNAFLQFTEFVTQHPTNEFAPQAQYWIADRYFRDANYPKAEEGYKEIFLRWPQSPLAREARLMAGRAALEGLRYQDAIGHFTNLTADVSCPADLKVRALFAYGGALMAHRPASTNQLENFEEAIRVFDSIQQGFPTNELSVLAWTEKARCWQQLGTAGVTNAWLAFTQVITNANVGVVARSEAQVGRGQLAELMARAASGVEQTNLLRRALDEYLDVVYEKNLTNPGETHDPFWVSKAGLAALPVLEALGELAQAEKLCVTLRELLPPLRATFQRKADLLRERRLAGKIVSGN